jgi:hypothetical protein
VQFEIANYYIFFLLGGSDDVTKKLRIIDEILKFKRVVSVYFKKKKKNSGSNGEPGVNEVSFCARPHHNVHNTLGVDIGATSPQ